MFNLEPEHRQMVGRTLYRYLKNPDGTLSIGEVGDRKLEFTDEEVKTILPYYLGQPEIVHVHPKGTMRAAKRAARGERSPAELEQAIEEAVPEVVPVPAIEPEPEPEPIKVLKVDRPRRTRRGRGR